MPYFNIIDCVSAAYRLLWRERAYLLKLAAIPLFIKFAFYVLSAMYGEAGNVIRLSLFMVPAYFAEGWMLCHFVRLMTNAQRWPYQMTGNDAQDLKAVRKRARPLLSGVITFVLINLSIALYFTVFTHFTPPEMLNGGEVKPEDIPQGTALIITLLFALMIAAFKLVWFYIPMAANIEPITYVKKLRGFGVTIRLIGLWLLCFAPIMVLMQLFVSPLLLIENHSASLQIIISLLTVVFDTFKNLIVTAGITLEIMQILSGPKAGAKK
jgi:hypothetical protein